jgi:hypothetical protein
MRIWPYWLDSHFRYLVQQLPEVVKSTILAFHIMNRRATLFVVLKVGIRPMNHW